MPFVKLDCGILNSTLWFEREAREVFLTALLMAEPMELTESTPQLEVKGFGETGWSAPPGWYGFVPAASVGIFARARVPDEAGFAALEILGAPEPASRTPDFEGRRLIRVDGGFLVLNYMKYRERDYTTAERSKRYRQRVASRRDITATHRDITQAEVQEEVHTEVSTVGLDQVRTGSNTVVSRAENSHNGNGLGHRTGELRQGNGANEPGSIPRDHMKCRICGGPTAKICFTYNQFDSLAKRYRGTSPEETETALKAFHEFVLTKIPDDKLAGDMVWLLKYFDAWLIEIGRVAPEPDRKKKKKEFDYSEVTEKLKARGIIQ